MLILNPYFLIVSGLSAIVLGMIVLKMNLNGLFRFWFYFLAYFFKTPTKLDKEREKNPQFPLGGWLFIFGWFLLLVGFVRLWGGNS